MTAGTSGTVEPTVRFSTVTVTQKPSPNVPASMPESEKPNRHRILFVDDEELSLKYFARVFSGEFDVETTASSHDALTRIENQGSGFSVVVADQRMPGMTGVDLLARVREKHPSIVRVLTTAYADHDAVVDAINTGAVFRYVSKPWDVDSLRTVIQRSIDYREAWREHRSIATGPWPAAAELLGDDRTTQLAKMSANLGHYVHNALCPLLLSLEMLIQDLDDEELAKLKQRRQFYVDFLRKTAARIREISTVLWSLRKATTPSTGNSLQKVDLRELLESLLAEVGPMLEERSIQLTLDVADSLRPVEAEYARLYEFFYFVLVDEIVSLSSGGRITIRISEADSRSFPSGGAAIEIVDQGRATPLEDQEIERIFEPFRLRPREEGDLGAFLVIAYLLAASQGARLTVSEQGNAGIRLQGTFPRVFTEAFAEHGSLRDFVRLDDLDSLIMGSAPD